MHKIPSHIIKYLYYLKTTEFKIYKSNYIFYYRMPELDASWKCKSYSNIIPLSAQYGFIGCILETS